MFRIVRTIVKYLLLSLGIVVLLLLFLWYRPTFTQTIKGQEAISELREVEINGQLQTILIRGTSKKNPVVLFLHGGPGMPIMYLNHSFQRPMEDYFTVVHWDQRGAGKSYHQGIDPKSINVRQFLEDTEFMVRYLIKRFDKNKIILVGHSWGTYLGSIFVNQHPDLIDVYVSVGQVVDNDLERDVQKRFLIDQSMARNDTIAMNLIEKKGTEVFEEFLFEYGGELKSSKNYYPLVWAGITSREYNLKDVMNVARGSGFCSENMSYNVLADNSILKNIISYQVPVYFFTGRYDMTTPASLISKYFDTIQAPDKKLVWFEKSAHFPFYEEPEAFSNKFIELLRKE